MALKYLIDTDICIYVINQKYESVIDRFETVSFGEAAMSVVTYAELLYGAHKSQFQKQAIQKLEALAQYIPPLSLPENAGRYYGKIRSLLEKKGKSIGGNDLWIAAHALSLDVILVTNNQKEFKRVAELKIENWCK